MIKKVMSEQSWMLSGLVIGLLVGITLGYIISFTLNNVGGSVLFERDSSGKISGIHYVPQSIKR